MQSQPDFKGLKKAELHAHLNGCIPPDVVSALVDRHNVAIPEGFILPKDLVITSPVGSLLDYFRPWNVFKRLPIGKECLDEMVDGALGSLAEDGIVYAELRNSPYNISEINGISMDEGLEWLADALATAANRHGVDARLIISFSRFRFDIQRAKDLLAAIGRIDHGQRIVGLDLSGNEVDPIEGDVAALFRQAKHAMGLGVTIHAGEFGGPDNIRWAIEECDADRVGHALALVDDTQLIDSILERGTCIEVCLTSNLRTGRISQLTDHPITRFVELGVPFVLCSDNPAVHQEPLSAEYQYFVDATGRHDMVEGMFDRQMQYAFK